MPTMDFEDQICNVLGGEAPHLHEIERVKCNIRNCRRSDVTHYILGHIVTMMLCEEHSKQAMQIAKKFKCRPKI